MIHHHGYTLTTPWAFADGGGIAYHWQIFKPSPQISRRSEETFADAESALAAAREYVESRVRELHCHTPLTTQEPR